VMVPQKREAARSNVASSSRVACASTGYVSSRQATIRPCARSSRLQASKNRSRAVLSTLNVTPAASSRNSSVHRASAGRCARATEPTSSVRAPSAM